MRSGNDIESVTSSYDHKQDQHYLVQVNREQKCICQLCSCGKHRCPRPQIRGQFQTSYNNHYKDTHLIVKNNPPPRYIYQERHYNPEALRTNYKESYTEKPHNQNEALLSNSRLQNLGKSVLRPNIPFYGTSAYSEQYKPFTLEANYNPQDDPYINRRQQIPNYGFSSPAKFDDSTAYKEHYMAPSPIKIPNNLNVPYQKPQIPFNGSSSYQEQYKKYQIQPSHEQYCQSFLNAPKVKFEGQSTYKQLFKGQKVVPVERSGKRCQLENTNIPYSKYMNSSPHVYHDQEQQNI